MDQSEISDNSTLHKFKTGLNLNFKLLIAVVVISIISGTGTGYLAAGSKSGNTRIPLLNSAPEHAGDDTQTFRDFAEGKITRKPEDKNSKYNTGTHLLIRDGATPVNLTSSVIDLAEYENKKVKLYGKTESAPDAGWFMDVGKIEVVN